ncbi:MAG: M15 family metallopeptidase [Bacillota bacterium]|nr:M15 family metallopeptidase [Bacillota bacterium]
MKRSYHERAKAFFINMGRRSWLLKGPAIIGLAVCMLLHRVFEYFRRGTKRFASAAFILLCFMVGNSFAYPVFQEESGFVSGNEKDQEVAVVADSDITLADEQEVAYEDLEILEDEDVLEGCGDAEFHGMENVDKYSLDEILNMDYQDEQTGGNIEDDAEADEKDIEAAEDIEFSADDWKLVLINKQHPIPDEYTFPFGVIKTIKGDMQCDERVIEELLAMMQAARNDGVNLEICSPYRDLSYQEFLFNRKIKAYMKKGMSYIEAYALTSQAVTVPGASEHQIGLAFDFLSDTYITLDEGFADTSAGIWLEEHCHEYGFILRYPKGKEYITSIEFEPWHFRYVGKEAATIIMEQELCLEEFWDKYL